MLGTLPTCSLNGDVSLLSPLPAESEHATATRDDGAEPLPRRFKLENVPNFRECVSVWPVVSGYHPPIISLPVSGS